MLGNAHIDAMVPVSDVGRAVEFYGPFATDDGVATLGDTHAAWITDPDGNVLEIVGA